MANIESISVLRKTDKLDEVSQNRKPLFVTKNVKPISLFCHTSFMKRFLGSVIITSERLKGNGK